MAKVKWDLEKVKELASDIGYEVLSTEYVNTHTHMKFKCPNGHEFEKKFWDFRNGSLCKYCNGWEDWDTKKAKEYIESQGYELVSDFISKSKDIIVKCPEGHENKTSIMRFHDMGHRCRKCSYKGIAKSNTFTIEEVRGMIESKGFKLISTEYVKSDVPLEIECPVGHLFTKKLKVFNTGQYCPFCTTSKGERVVNFLLSKMLPDNIKYKPQKKIVLNGRRYYYDFGIFYGDGIYIEYDGQQHERDDHFWERGRKKGTTKESDATKTKYCQDNNIPLIRIRFNLGITEIRDFLHKELSKYMEVNYVEDSELVNADSYYGKDEANIKEVANYLLTHSAKETAKEFGVSQGTVYNYFESHYGMKKKMYNNKLKEEYLKNQSE